MGLEGRRAERWIGRGRRGFRGLEMASVREFEKSH